MRAILGRCCLLSALSPRNHGMGDTSIKFEVVPGKNQKSEYVMACGKHTVRGWCKPPTPAPAHLLSVTVGSAAWAHLGLSHVLMAPRCACRTARHPETQPACTPLWRLVSRA